MSPESAANSLPLNDPATIALFPSRPSRITLYRWRTQGVRGRVLRTFPCGGTVWVSREAIADFLAPDTPAPDRKKRRGRHRRPTCAR